MQHIESAQRYTQGLSVTLTDEPLYIGSVQGINRLVVLSFKNENERKNYKQCYLPTVEIKDYNVIINERNFFDQPVKNDIRTYGNIGKIEIG